MNILYKSIKYISIAAVLALFLGAAQFGQLMSSSNDVRKHAIEGWAGADQERQEKMEEFTQACLVGRKAKREDFKKAMEIHQKDGLPELVIKNCAERNGYTELYEVINKADSILQSVGWPLSLLVKL